MREEGGSRITRKLKQGAHLNQPTAWPLPHACAQPYHHYCLGESFKCQLHTTHVAAVGWEPQGSSPTTCSGKADHGFGVCMPLALSLSFENSEQNCSTA